MAQENSNKVGEEGVEIVASELEELFELLHVDAEVTVSSEEENIYSVTIDSSDNALLIGRYGDTLSSLEHVLSLLTSAKTGEYPRITIEIGGYRESREEYLKSLAERTRDEVLSSGDSKELSDLKPWERRLIHLFLSEDSQVVTESHGEGRNRVLLVKKA